MSTLPGKVTWITGGSSGIGLAAARAFLNAGARVAITGRNEARLEHAAAELGRDSILAMPADVGDADQVSRLVAAIRSQWGPVEVLVNNAGLNIKNRAVRELTPQTWEMLRRTNLDGAFHCIHAVLPDMRQRRDGVIINISSVAGKRAMPLSGGGYAAAKFGMAALGICLAAEEKDSGIRVSNIYPGEVDTPILEQRPQPVTQEHRRTILRPEDVAAAIIFVASLPPHVSVPELIIKPTAHVYV